ncbi:anti-sigma factor family protein [Actinomadura parmotrematis]|uniref:Zf-HC2 domain-containing protein n=1 Tax=Actinomadura parmotrematis TaxID=2864039 RepID=A0ABS7G097_9ACTN|nr:zf-HC2 domain-containing protein [Actinomadura parmotrematis]MBW8485247.1 zf-HC2 domain-containing protein [Actinomadura parmotrematis]
MTECARTRGALGVYVLGAIDPAERTALEEHLEGCPACRDELAGLAGLPALLGRVDERQIEELAGPPPELLETLLARAAEDERPVRRLRRLPWTPLAAAACALLVAGGIAGGLLGGSRGRTVSEQRPVPPASVSAEPSARVERLTAVNARTGVKGYVLVSRKRWGTSLEIYVAGVAKGSNCRLRVLARNGQHDVLGSWSVPAEKGYGEYEASTRFQRDDLYSFEIVTVDGQPLLTIPA